MAIIYDPLKTRSTELELVIDTGFQGGVLPPLKTHVDLGLNLIEEPKTKAGTAVGYRVELRRPRGLINVNGEITPCTVYTALGVKQPLLERGAG